MSEKMRPRQFPEMEGATDHFKAEVWETWIKYGFHNDVELEMDGQTIITSRQKAQELLAELEKKDSGGSQNP